jgi:hypothetical protein
MWGERVWAMDGTTWLFNDGQCQSLRRPSRSLTKQLSTTTITLQPSFSSARGVLTPRLIQISHLKARQPLLLLGGLGSFTNPKPNGETDLDLTR